MGAMGSATVYELASRGLRVLGLERFDIPHDRGSSHGVSRIIRLAYSEHPSYVPLLRRAYERWRELESAAGEKLLHITGSVDTGRPEGPVFSGSLAVLHRARPAARDPQQRGGCSTFSRLPVSGGVDGPCTSRMAGSSCRSGASSRT